MATNARSARDSVGDIARGRMALRVREAEIHANEKDAELKTAEGESATSARRASRDVYNRMAELESKRRAIHRRSRESHTTMRGTRKIALAKYSESSDPARGECQRSRAGHWRFSLSHRAAPSYR